MDGGGFDRAEENMQKRADRDARLIRQHSRLEFQKDDSVPSVCLSLFLPPSLHFLQLHFSLLTAPHNS